MSTPESIKQKVRRIRRGSPFTNKAFSQLGSRGAVDTALSRMVKTGDIERSAKGVFVRPKQNALIGKVMPGVTAVIEALAKRNGEVIQTHGAEAANLFGLSTQVPVTPVFCTSGSSRQLYVGNVLVEMKHVSPRKLQYAGTPAGLALAAMWYLGKECVNISVIEKVKSRLSGKEFKSLLSVDSPGWLKSVFRQHAEQQGV